MLGKLILGRYRVQYKLGEGGMGEVFLARHTMLSMPVVAKIVREPNPALLQRFEREAMTMARVQHVNVVRVLDFGVHDNLPVLVMEYISGESVAERLGSVRVLPWPYIFEICAQVLDGLAAVHAAGIIHRDVKPENIMIAAGRPEIAKLLDFGIVRDNAAGQRRLTATGLTIGTPAYMAPEQLAGLAVGPAADIYALATTIWEAIAGDLPFDAGVQDLSLKLTTTPPPPVPPAPHLPPLSQAAADALSSMLAPVVEQRASDPATCSDMLRRAVADFRPSTGPTPRPNAAPVETSAGPPEFTPPRPTGPRSSRRWESAFRDPTIVRPPRSPANPPVGNANIDVDAPSDSLARPSMPSTAVGPLVVAARLPARALKDAAERRWLASLFGPAARSFTLGDGFLIVVEPRQTSDDSRDRQRVHTLARQLRERFGESVRIAGRHASSSFSLTPAALTGAGPMPSVVQSLLARLAE
ncbi:MAG: protein kinase [Deltaproteobacteria bacterium]|nr:protein kinase [Deltaproteobacteria bacterium]